LSLFDQSLHRGLKKGDPLQAGLGYRAETTPLGPFSNRIRVIYVLGYDDLRMKNIAGFSDITVKRIDAG
jgi:hypothetical protein